MKLKMLVVLILGVLFFSLIATGISAMDYETKNVNVRDYTEHEPIKIDSNSEFNPLHGVVSGSGTVDDPYIISGWKIDGHNSSKNAIYIGNTTAYFIIENCYLYNTSEVTSIYNRGAGVYLYKVIHGIVRSNVMEDIGGIGVDLYQSSYNSIDYNLIFQTTYTRDFTGITPSQSDNNTFNGNVIRNAHTGIMVSTSSNNTFSNNVIYHSKYNGITLYADSNYNLVINNSITHNNEGIYIYWGANNNTVKGNFIANNTGYGIEINDLSQISTNNKVIKNIFYYNNGSSDYYDSSTVQASDSATKNYWYAVNQGYGNYWREWANNNATNDQDDDGIVDWVYQIDGSSGKSDKFPLKYTVPGPPQELVALTGSGFVNLSWKVPIGDGGKQITSYNIYRNGTLIATVSGTQLYYNDTNVLGDVTYQYYVVAVNEEGEGLHSNYVQATPGTVIPEFTPLIGLSLVAIIAVIAIYRKI